MAHDPDRVASRPWRIATDVGGTFTDLVLDGGGSLRSFKAPTTPDDPTRGVLDAVAAAAAGLELSVSELLARCGVFVHGTTRALNAMLTGQTARTALFVTAGHPDILLFREGGRRAPFDLAVEYPKPLVPRALTFEIPERVLSDGRVRRALDEVAVLDAIASSAAREVEAVAVSFLWSVVNGAHERRVGDLLDMHLPDVPYTLSHELNPTLREYRRTSSTAIDASLKPLMATYIDGLEDRLRDAGLAGELLLVSSTGGTISARHAAAAPIHALNSGPAMAPYAARRVVGEASSTASLDAVAVDAVVFDSGGTTCDISLVRDGSVISTRETWIGPVGAGHITGFSSVDIRSIAAGGGSIASVDAGGLLRVGPRSAGASPGPACYGRGGTEPTVTDASLVRGYLDPEHFLDGSMPLDRAAAAGAVGRVAGVLGVSVRDAAEAILELATEQMVSAIELIMLGQGVDPREAALVGGGGAAGLNIVAIARRLGARSAVVPAFGAVLSAAGALLSPLVQEHAVTYPTSTDRFDLDGVAAVLAELRARAGAFVANHTHPGGTSWIEHAVEARYRNQVWDLVVSHPDFTNLGPAQVDEVAARFHQAHAQAFGISDPTSAVECLTWRVRASCDNAPGGTEFVSTERGHVHSPRAVSFGREGVLDSRVMTPVQMPLDEAIYGPLVVEAAATTVVIPPGASVTRSPAGHLVIEPGVIEPGVIAPEVEPVVQPLGATREVLL